MASVTLSDVRKRFGDLETIHGVSIDIADGEFVTLVGPSGCGKSTLLRMIAGLESVTSGSVSIGGGCFTTVSSRPIGRGARVRAAADLGDVDGQLALRLLSCNPAPVWRSLSLSGAVLESIYGREQHAPEGTLLPILETELGEPVVAVGHVGQPVAQGQQRRGRGLGHDGGLADVVRLGGDLGAH